MSVRVTFCEWLSAPLVPVIVKVKVPVEPPLCVVMLSVEEPEPLAGTATTGGLKLAEVLLGKPLTDRLTLPEKPFTEVRVTA